MTTKAINVCHPSVLIPYFNLFIVIYQKDKRVIHVAERSCWDKSKTIPSLFAHMRQQLVAF